MDNIKNAIKAEGILNSYSFSIQTKKFNDIKTF